MSMSYSQRYSTPSPLFPQPSPTTLERLIQSWEELRKLDVEGYRTSRAHPLSTWLVDIQWADGRSVRSPGRGTTCSPFTTQSVAMAYSPQGQTPLRPVLSDGRPLSFLFSRAANGTLGAASPQQLARYGMTLADNEWPRPIIFFNLGYAVPPTQLRRGDAVHIDWMTGGGHAVFCWDVHLNARGEVDAFQYVSSNGRIRTGATCEGARVGVSIGGTPCGSSGYIRQSAASPVCYEVLRSPLFVDDERYTAEAAWVTWNPQLKLSDLVGCRVRPRGKLSYARVVKAARFHGVSPPPPFAMVPAGVSAKSLPSSGPLSEQRLLQKQLGVLIAAGVVEADVGDSEITSAVQLRSVVRSFQAKFGLVTDGIAGPKTKAKLREAYAAACVTPAAKQYLATGAVSSPDEEDPAVAFSLGSVSPRVHALYFRHGTVTAGKEVALVVEAEGIDFGSTPWTLYLRCANSTERLPVSCTWTCQPGRATTVVHIPKQLGAWPPQPVYLGIASLEQETSAPLYVTRSAIEAAT